MKKKGTKVIQDEDDDSVKLEKQNLLKNKASLLKNKEENHSNISINNNNELIKKIPSRISSDNPPKIISKGSNYENNYIPTELKLKGLNPSKNISSDLSDLNLNSAQNSTSNYSQINNNPYSKNLNYNSEKNSNIIIQKKILYEYPITYEEVISKIKAYCNKKTLFGQRIQNSNVPILENKQNVYGNINKDCGNFKKNDQMNLNINNNHNFEENIKKKINGNNVKNSIEHFNTNNNTIFNNSNMKKSNENFTGFNPSNIIINSNNNYNNINLNIINKERINEAEKNIILKSNIYIFIY